MKNAVNAAASADSRHATGDGLIARIRDEQRRRLVDAFRLFRQGSPADTVLSIHMHAAPGEDADILAAYSTAQERACITSHEFQSHAGPEDGNVATTAALPSLPFADQAYDWIFCSEVIEYAGGFVRQAALVAELHRVARKGVFLTTPNRRHPLEFHTGLPLLHWLSPLWGRRIRGWLGKRSSTPPFRLLDAPALYRMAEALPARPAHDVGHKRVFGIKAFFFLMISKDTA